MRHWIDLFEALDRVIPFTWQHFANDDLVEYEADFQIGEGHFRVVFKEKYYERGYWELSFVRNGSFDMSGTGSAMSVLATVMQITREFISATDPHNITYSAKNTEGSRNKLYPKLMRLLMKEFPEYVEKPEKKARTYTSYQVSRPARPYVAPTPNPKAMEPETNMTQEEWDDIESFLNDLRA